MPRFEMYLMIAEKSEENIETSEIEMVCWVNDPEDLGEVQEVANEVSKSTSMTQSTQFCLAQPQSSSKVQKY